MKDKIKKLELIKENKDKLKSLNGKDIDLGDVIKHAKEKDKSVWIK